MPAGNDTAAPIIIGLIVGVGFIVLIAIIFSGPTEIVSGENVSLVTIPKGASFYQDPDRAFEPKEVKVVIGVNNTVRWINQDIAPVRIEADDSSDPDFDDATKDRAIILPGKSFEFTFTNAGEFGYHGQPWQRGIVIVLP